MREIKFRARAAVNDNSNGIKVGDFVFGHFIQSGVDAPCIIFGDGEQVEIDLKTLGQYTGLKDCNGVEIYEGDILSFHHDAEEGEFDTIGPVFFDDYLCWSVDHVKGHRWGEGDHSEPLAEWTPEFLKVIGNTHQNPELLEDK